MLAAKFNRHILAVDLTLFFSMLPVPIKYFEFATIVPSSQPRALSDAQASGEPLRVLLREFTPHVKGLRLHP